MLAPSLLVRVYLVVMASHKPLTHIERRTGMKRKILVPISSDLKQKLDVKRAEGFTINGFVRATLEKALADVKVPRRRRAA